MAEVSTRPGALRLVLGDQLSDGLSALRDLDPAADQVLMAEVLDEATYVRHHKQKVALVFASMRKFAARLAAHGARVRYVRIDDPASTGSIAGELQRALGDGRFGRVVLTECGELRLAEALAAFALTSTVPVSVREDDRFLCSHDRFRRWAAGKSQLRMEFFYREMRRETGLLMAGREPAGGQWNYDKENRRKLPSGVRPPGRVRITPDAVTREAIRDVERLFPEHFGDTAAFAWP
ncbi:MAG: cryptochrome/photolyase family protein, partial [Brevundimonas sp.]